MKKTTQWTRGERMAGGSQRGDSMKTFSSFTAAVGLLLLSGAAVAQVATPTTSGVYLTADDYKNGRLSFEGDCGSKAHKLELLPYPVKSFTSLLTTSEAITTTSCPCQGSAGALLSEMCLGKELARR
jgi:hypothetical protein